MSAHVLRPRMRTRWGAGPQIVIVCLIIGLFGALAIEPTRQLLEQRARISGMATDLERVERSNERLENRVARLKDPDFLEQRARTQIGLVRPGETTYVVMPPSRRADRRSDGHRRKQARAESPEPPGLIEGFLNFLGLP